MEVRSSFFAGYLVFFAIGVVGPLSSTVTQEPSVPKAISDPRDSIVRDWASRGAEGLKVSGFDVRDALLGQSVAYEFDIEVDRKFVPIKLLEDVNHWDVVDLPIFWATVENREDDKLLVERERKVDRVVTPVLPPFQLSGPVELWIQDADDMRLALPHDVDAGTLRKVLLSNGSSYSERCPLCLLKIAEALRLAAHTSDQPLLSLRIDGPSSLTSSTSASPNNKLKLKRLSPGLVELSSRTANNLSPEQTLWPLTSLNGSDSKLRGIEELLTSVLGKKGSQKGKFKLMKVETKPEKVAAHFEVLARLEEGGKVVPERIQEVHPFQVADSVMQSVDSGNVSMTQMPFMYPPQNYFTL
ncbi:hypothetical protein HPP92_018788 [Vanilla planifolia]|uniref:Uncharacterized protein n=1 Tax=Vanilla planifolia TaxID=51239 RepID=A0A835QE87_VANPL|nr:hypothetical protein HPP92_018788 [Vanilla planifolia]